MLPRLSKADEVKRPGSKGGKFYRTKAGKIRYGEPPTPEQLAGDPGYSDYVSTAKLDIEREFQGLTDVLDIYGQSDEEARDLKIAVNKDLASRIEGQVTDKEVSDTLRDVYVRGGAVIIRESSKDSERTMLVRAFIDQWAASSGDHNDASIAQQLAVAEEFEIKEGSLDHLPQPFAEDDPLAPASIPTLRKLVRAQYDATQAYLKEKGIEYVTLVRGCGPSTRVIAEPGIDPERPAICNIELQPASSFSTGVWTAVQFASQAAKERSRSGQGVEANVFIVRVPADRVLSFPRTGWGCLSEREIVILGGERQAVRIPWINYPVETGLDSLQDIGDRVQSALHAISKANGSKTRSTYWLDVDIENADWPKRTNDLTWRTSARVEKAKEVKKPGSRGGRFYYADNGDIRYGIEPAEEVAVQQEAAHATSRGSAVALFSPKEIAQLTENTYKSRSKLIEMRIADFLALAEPGHSPSKEATVARVLAQGGQFSTLPFLRVTSDEDTGITHVDGHEGRHRAKALLALGYDTIPVEFRSDVIRWDQQDDPENFDYIKHWPTQVISQDGSVTLPFPVKRESAGEPEIAEARIRKSDKVLRPGLRGGRWYRADNGDIRYGIEPTEEVASIGDRPPLSDGVVLRPPPSTQPASTENLTLAQSPIDIGGIALVEGESIVDTVGGPLREAWLKAVDTVKDEEVEHAHLLGKDGKIVFTQKGTEREIKFSKEEQWASRGTVMVHNHPAGSNLSEADAIFAMRHGLVEIHAIGQDVSGSRLAYWFRPKLRFPNAIEEDPAASAEAASNREYEAEIIKSMRAAAELAKIDVVPIEVKLIKENVDMYVRQATLNFTWWGKTMELLALARPKEFGIRRL